MEGFISNWLIQIKKGYLDLCILRLIKWEKKVYGFRLLSLLEEMDIHIKEGTLYPLLNRMTKDGLLTSNWETPSEQGHPRKFYSLTPKGELSLEVMEKEYKSMYKVFKKIN